MTRRTRSRLPPAVLATASCLLAGAASAAAPAVRSDSPMTPPDRIKPDPSSVERKLDTPLRSRLSASDRDRATRDETSRNVANDGASEPVTVRITGTVTPDLAAAIEAAHGTVVEQSARWGVMTATLPLASVLSIAARSDVRRIGLPPRARTNAPSTPLAP